MNELRAVVDAAERARSEGRPAILATVVRVRGSSYRKPGARMLLTEEGWQAGSVSGGCLEADILRRAWWRTRAGAPTVVTYDSTVSDDADLDEELAHGFGLGCNGVVDILLERLEPSVSGGPVAAIADCLDRRRSGVIATVVEADGCDFAVGQRVCFDTSGDPTRPISDQSLAARIDDLCRDSLMRGVSQNVDIERESGSRAHVFIEVIHPPMPLLICGAGHDAVPLARMASELGWAVTVIDPRPGSAARPDRFTDAEAVIACAPDDLRSTVRIDDRTAAVVMSHNTVLDAALLRALLPSPARYVGVLGPRQRTERLLQARANDGFAQVGMDRLFGPVGLDIGADTPEAIALSILAEIQAVTQGRTAGHLSSRPAKAFATLEFPACPITPLPTPQSRPV